MFGPALRRIRGASRIQARSPLCPSARDARDVIAFAVRGRHEKGSNGSQQSSNSDGHGQRHGGRLPLRSTAVAGISMLAGAVTSDDSDKPKWPSYAYRDPLGFNCLDSNPSILMNFTMRVRQAIETDSIEEARSAQFDFTRSFLEAAVYGDVVDEGSLPSDVVFGAGRYVKKEDTKVFWVPSAELGKSSILCLSVNYDLSDGERGNSLLVKALATGMLERLLERFEGDERIYLHVHFSTGFFGAGCDRDEVKSILEHTKSLSGIQK